MNSPQIENKDEVLVDGKIIGAIKGLRFNYAKSDNDAEPVDLHKEAIAKELSHASDRLIGAPNDQIILSTDGSLRWKGEKIASLSKGEDKYFPKIILLADDQILPDNIKNIEGRLNLWLRHHINSLLELILALKNPHEIDGLALELCTHIFDNYGIVARQKVVNIVKGLDQDVRAKLRRFGIKFGAYHVYLPLTLKPAPRELLLILWALQNDDVSQEETQEGTQEEGLAQLAHIILSGRTSVEINPAINKQLYEVGGFKVAGKRAVRIDILERLADLIRPLIALDSDRYQGEQASELPVGAAPKNGFRVNVEMTSLLGCAGADFSSVLTSLGYRVERTKIEEIIKEEVAKEETEINDDVVSLAKIDGENPTNIENDKSKKPSENKADENSEAQVEQFDEVWFFNFQRQANKGNANRDNVNKHKVNNRFANSKNKENNKKPYKDSKQKGANFKRKPKPKSFDKDSPFAALAALKIKS
ncbi:MAG: hypothetical protein L3J15_06260 [Devosiaceae bacterium]|nr:hypothetical protein [Devosiaceae bacterium]